MTGLSRHVDSPGDTGWTAFDSLASSYERWYRSPVGSFSDRVEHQAIFGLLDPKAGELVLDVGSGTGGYARRLARRGVSCVGLEPSGSMLSVAHQSSWVGGPRFVRGVGEHLPLASAVFDAVIFVTTLEFVRDVDAALSEAARVTKPGGRVVLGVLNARGPWAARRRRSEDAVWKSARFFSRAEIEERLRMFGEVRSQVAVYVPPQLGMAPRSVFTILEWLGARIASSVGAFIALRVDLRR